MNDERQGQPSASSFHRYELCAGSYQLEQEAKRIGQSAHQSNRNSERGKRIHQWLSDPDSIVLEGEELATAQALQDRANEQVRRIFGDDVTNELREKRLWLKPVQNAEE